MNARYVLLIGVPILALMAGIGYHGSLITRDMRYSRVPLDEVIPAIFMDTTKWAPGYTDAKFSSIQPGMTTNQVVQILGPPLVMRGNDFPNQYWHYTSGHDGGAGGMSECDGSTHGRIVIFTESMMVTNAAAFFYVD